jgi:DNA polymerase III alpha subunit (gram-positive type)
MGTYVEASKLNHLLGNAFVFDLEYVGTSSNLSDCYIWDMAFTHLVTNSTFEISIIPDVSPIPGPFSEEFATVTTEMLEKRNATSFANAWLQLNQFINSVKACASGPIMFIAHNCFKSDKLMLEIDCERHAIRMPYSWYFFDSLIYCRKVIVKQASYTLNDIHNYMFDKDIENHHFAISDALALKNVLISLDLNLLEGPIYPSYHTSLQAVKWLGPSSERILFSFNVRSVEMLVQQIVLHYCDRQLGHMHIPLQQFVESYFIENYGIKKGNAVSISNSLIQKWIQGI